MSIGFIFSEVLMEKRRNRAADDRLPTAREWWMRTYVRLLRKGEKCPLVTEVDEERLPVGELDKVVAATIGNPPDTLRKIRTGARNASDEVMSALAQNLGKFAHDHSPELLGKSWRDVLDESWRLHRNGREQ